MISQFFKFLAIGVTNTLVGLTVIAAAMYLFNTNPIVANAVGYLVGVAASFALNGRLTFRQNSLSGRMFARFVAVCIISYIANVAAVWLWLDHDKYTAQVIGMAVYLLVNFSGSRMFVFRQ